MDFLQEFSVREWVIFGIGLVSILFNVLNSILSANKKTNILDSVKEAVIEWLPIAINLAEVSGTSGENKRSAVIRNALGFVAKKLGRQLTEDESIYFTSYVGNQLEMILSTPQKKEEMK